MNETQILDQKYIFCDVFKGCFWCFLFAQPVFVEDTLYFRKLLVFTISGTSIVSFLSSFIDLMQIYADWVQREKARKISKSYLTIFFEGKSCPAFCFRRKSPEA